MAAVVTCPLCGAPAPQTARFCAACGAALSSSDSAGDVRKTVSAVFCDVTGSTVFVRALDPEASRRVMEQYFAVVSAVLARHGGTVEKFVGDAVMAVFGVPVAHEDDALRACRAAVEILAAVNEVDRNVHAIHGVHFGVRIGVETGEVVVGDAARGSTFASGAPVNTAARLEQAAQPGQCLVGPDCYRLVRDLVVVEPSSELEAKGIDGALQAWPLLAVHEADDERTSRGPMVGRSRELALLHQALDRAAADRTCQLATVLGIAGIGKTRLANEFLAAVEQDATVLRGRCVSYGEGVTYWPLVQVVRQIAGLTGAEPEAYARAALATVLAGASDTAEVVDRVAPVAGLGGVPGPPEDTAWAVQRLLEAMASDRTVVLMVDDLHWAEPGLVTVLETLCDSSRDAPILLMVLARPEFLDDHPSWGAGRINAVAALLEPLRDDEVDDLTTGLVGGVLPHDAADRVRQLAGGNPLFVEQLLAMLVEDGTLTRNGAGWVLHGDLTTRAIPPTITALLTARLDRLPAPARAVLAAASVIGQVFYRSAVAELSTAPDQVSGELRALVRSGLIRPAPSDMAGQDGFRFTHVLIRDAAYAALPKVSRAELHERFARWIVKHFEGRPYDDFVGSHLEAAYHLRAELGAVDDSGRRLGLEAAERLAAAGQLLLFADERGASALLERADALRTDDGPDRWALQIELARARWHSREASLNEVGEVARRVLLAAETAGNHRWAALAALELGRVRQRTDPAGATEALRQASFAALEIFAPEDHYGLSVAHDCLSNVATMTLQTADDLRHKKLAAKHAELAGRPGEAQKYLRSATILLIFGDCPAKRGLAESRHQLQQAEYRAGRAFAATDVAFWATLLGKQEEALRSRALAEELSLGLRPGVFGPISFVLSLAETFIGNWLDASRLLAELCETLEPAGDLGLMSTVAALHGHALLHLGQPNPARLQLDLAHRISADDDVLTQALVHAGRGWLAALEHDPASFRQHIAAATALLPHDLLPVRALCHESCAEAAAALGEDMAANQHRQRALALHRAKGNAVSVARLQEIC